VLRFFIFASVICISAQGATNELKLPQITIGTNIYKAVTLSKRNAAEALIRFDGGITKVKISDLPEPYKTDWFDSEAAEKLEAETRERAQEGAKQNAAAERERMNREIVQNYVQVGDNFVPKAVLKEVQGKVINTFGSNVLIIGLRDIPPPINRSQRMGAAVRFTPERSSLPFGRHALIRNSASRATGTVVTYKAFKTTDVQSVDGVTAEVWDCGTVPFLK
jgi:hypothetical protein